MPTIDWSHRWLFDRTSRLLCAPAFCRLYSIAPQGGYQAWGMISCQDVVDFCLDYLEGALPEEEKNRFRSHLSACGECGAFFETYRRTPQVSRDALVTEMPGPIKDAVRSYLRTRCSGE
jgi:hypothetical protein